MIRLFTTPLTLNFWAHPHTSMPLIADWRTSRAERNTITVRAHGPEYLDEIEAHVTGAHANGPRPDYPTDVPAPEPHDVPAPEPMDPPPDPGEDPEQPAAPPSRPGEDPRPRPIP